jgi:hypothetical protein
MESKKFTLNKEDLIKIGVGALVAIAGAATVYFSEVISQVDFGQWTPVAVAAASILINASRKFIEGE